MEMTIKFQLALAVLLVAVWIQSVQCKIIGKAEVDFSGYCSDASIPPGSTYWQSLNLTLSDIVANTPNATNLTYTVKHGRDDVTSYGQGVCFNQPPHEVCRECIAMLVKRAWIECSSSISVVLMLTGQCALRYQDTPIDVPPPAA
ncbi:uncharacterized protein LOC9642167 [Selaginella moellendorffii]|uniref:uncharacterized protein LOC9642167 n=1 Tax=Selaginella moellendorffii TaxID=88036 RepID=UPI000D1C38D5|nr:uncharacterized protein LOC9642167 [Selaginella moellendorffii]|eukprot:XP_024534202.1 uncharacterized protein LOC9642167 [Selaginella moellendorffii]